MEKCKLALSIPGKSLRLDMPLEDAEFWFSTLASVLLEQKETKEVKDQRLDSAPQETEVEKVTRHKSVIGIKESRAPLDNQEAYKGFLRIRCEVCGDIRGFCSKKPIRQSWCSCGECTPLIDLNTIYANCSVCGHTWKYMTNNVEPMDEITCLECGAPITLERDKHGNYQTIDREA